MVVLGRPWLRGDAENEEKAIKKAVAWQLGDMVPIFVVGQQDKAPGERGFRIGLAMSWTAGSG